MLNFLVFSIHSGLVFRFELLFSGLTKRKSPAGDPSSLCLGGWWHWNNVATSGWNRQRPRPCSVRPKKTCIAMADKGTQAIPRWWQLKYFLFSPRKLGKWSNLTSIFFRWVETTNQIPYCWDQVRSATRELGCNDRFYFHWGILTCPPLNW